MGKMFALAGWRASGNQQRRNAQPELLALSSRFVNFRFFGKRRSQLNERNARITELRAAMHTLDHQFDFVNRLRVIAYANQVRPLEELIGNVLRKCVFVIERDLERRNAIVFQPGIFVAVVVISRLNQNAIKRKRTFHVKRYAFADAIALDAFNPWRLNLSAWIVLYINDVIIVFALRV